MPLVCLFGEFVFDEWASDPSVETEVFGQSEVFEEVMPLIGFGGIAFKLCLFGPEAADVHAAFCCEAAVWGSGEFGSAAVHGCGFSHCR